MGKFWLSLTQDNKVAIITTLVTVLSIAVGAAISIWQIGVAKRREIEARAHEQRKERYEQLLNVIQEIFSNMKAIEKGKMPVDQKAWLDLQFGIATYASSDVFEKYIEFRQTAERMEKEKIQEKKPDGMMLILLLGQLILLMRKEVGFSDDKVSLRDVLGTFINDIYNPEYDHLFRKVS